MHKTAYLQAMGVPVWLPRATSPKVVTPPIYGLYSTSNQMVAGLGGGWSADELALLERMLVAIELRLVQTPLAVDEGPILPLLVLGADMPLSQWQEPTSPALRVGDQRVLGVGD